MSLPPPPCARPTVGSFPPFCWYIRSGAWDAGGVSNPELVETEGGMWYLYYAGHPERTEGGERSSKSAIGVAVAVGDDLSRWTRLET